MQHTPQPDPPSDAEVARYASEVAVDLRRLMDGRPELRVLAFLLDVARVEAEKRVIDVETTTVQWPGVEA